MKTHNKLNMIADFINYVSTEIIMLSENSRLLRLMHFLVLLMLSGFVYIVYNIFH